MKHIEIKNIREKFGLSRDQIASITKSSPRTVQEWELGRRNMPEAKSILLIQFIKDSMRDHSPITKEEIADIRNKMGLNQTELGELLHVSKTTVSNWETGFSSIDYAHEQLLRRLLETHVYKEANQRIIRFKDFMRDEKLSQKDIADITDQSQPWVSKVANSKIELDDKYIELISNKYPSFKDYIEYGGNIHMSDMKVVSSAKDNEDKWALGDVTVFNWQGLMEDQSLSITSLATILGVTTSRVNKLIQESENNIPIPQNKYKTLVEKFGNNVISQYCIKKPLRAKGGTLVVLQKNMKPFYDIDFHASPDVELMDPVGRVEPNAYISVPQFRDVDFYIRVRGDSMYPKYRHGDIIPVKQVDSTSFFVYYEPYAIVTKTNNQLLIKYIHPHSEDKNKLLLVSYNSDKFPPQEIDKEEIEKLFHIKGSIGL